MELKNKNIIVTGAAGGIGRCLVKSLLLEGATVAAVDCAENKLAELKSEFSSFGEGLVCYLGDVGDVKFVSQCVENFFIKCGKIDALVNNAAILKDEPLISIFRGKLNKLSLDNWNKTISTNLNGVLYFGMEVAEKMVLNRTNGVIINVSSISAAGNAGQSAYSSAKAGVNALTVTWASELAPFGIRVAGLAPGMTDTDMPKKAMSEQALLAWVKKSVAKRMGLPEEIAEGILFILRNDFFCGRVLEIDGGLRM